jgi:hypothetical protein
MGEYLLKYLALALAFVGVADGLLPRLSLGVDDLLDLVQELRAARP